MIKPKYKNEVISFRTAQLAKKIFRDIVCYDSYNEKGVRQPGLKDTHNQKDDLWAAPTQSLLARWLREENNVHVTVKPYTDEQGVSVYYIVAVTAHFALQGKYYTFFYTKDEEGKTVPVEEREKLLNISYEEAFEIGLEQACEFILKTWANLEPLIEEVEPPEANLNE